MRHIEISPAQRAGAEKLLKELEGADEKKLAAVTEQDAQVNEDAGGGQEIEIDSSDNALAKLEMKDEPPVSETEEGAEASAEGAEATEEEKTEKPLSAEELAIAAQERLLSEEKPDNDKLPLHERAEWKKHRLRMKELAAENERLRAVQASTPLAPPVNFTQADADAAIAKLQDDWDSGRLNIDYAALEEKKTAIRTAQVVMQLHSEQTKQAQQAAKRATMDATIKKQEVSLPGLRKAFDAVIQDPLLGGNALLGQIVEKNLQNGSGLALLYFLHHHRQTAEEILTSSPDEAAVRLHEIRTRLTKTRKPAPGPAGRPSPKISNSHIPDRSERDRATGEDSGVQAEISKHLRRFAPHRFQK